MPYSAKTAALTGFAFLAPILSATVAVQALAPAQPACAQTSIPECVKSLINQGVSPDVAAQTCAAAQSGSQTPSGKPQPNEDCIQNKMMEYKTQTPYSGPDEDGRWRYDEQAERSVYQQLGCERKKRGFLGLGGNSWLCTEDSITYLFAQRGRNHATVLCAGGESCITSQLYTQKMVQLQGVYDSNYVKPGEWLYGNPPNISYSEMSSQGCQQRSLKSKDGPYLLQWVCPTPSVQYQVQTSTGVSLDTAIRNCAIQLGVRLN